MYRRRRHLSQGGRIRRRPGDPEVRSEGTGQEGRGEEVTLKEIVEDYLKKNDYEGLSGDDCGCEIGDLMPCDTFDGSGIRCVPGHKEPCPGGEDCPADGDCPWHMVPGKAVK
jgi:hypothetical protein